MSKIFLTITLLFLASCKSYDVIPGAERVRVLETEPKGCIFVGEVSSVQKDPTVGTLETEMDLATRIDLRNKAFKLGANIIVFLKGRNTQTLPTSLSAEAIALPKQAGSAAAAKPAAASASASASGTSAAQNAGPEQIDNEDREIVFIATTFRCPSSILNQ